MLILSSTSDIVRVITAQASQIEVHASYADWNGTTVTPGRTNTIITTATTTTVVASPGSGVQRNVRHLNITNDHASASCVVSVEHSDGTTIVELMSFTLLPGENMIFGEEGRWAHRDANGAEYPPAGKGAYDGRSVGFMKSGTAADAIGYWYCTSKDAGFPGAWSPGTPGVNGRVTDGTVIATDAGCVPIKNPAVGANYLTELLMGSSVPHYNLFFDVLWVNSGLVVTTTTAQSITTPTLPARDVNGTTNGEGCMIGLLFTAAATNAALITNTTVSYTNSAGVAGRTATLQNLVGACIPATPVIGTLVWFSLQAGDTGVRSIENITLNTSLVTGSISLFIARDVASIGNSIAYIPSSRKLADPGVRLYNGTCLLHCVQASATTVTFFNGELTVQEK